MADSPTHLSCGTTSSSKQRATNDRVRSVPLGSLGRRSTIRDNCCSILAANLAFFLVLSAIYCRCSARTYHALYDILPITISIGVSCTGSTKIHSLQDAETTNKRYHGWKHHQRLPCRHCRYICIRSSLNGQSNNIESRCRHCGPRAGYGAPQERHILYAL